MHYEEYQGWRFERRDDGSIHLTPKAGEENLTVPKEEVPRLVSFLVTGQIDNEDVIGQIQNLGRAASTV